MTLFWKVALTAAKQTFVGFGFGMLLFGLPWCVLFLIVLGTRGYQATQTGIMAIIDFLPLFGIAGTIVWHGYRQLRPLGRKAWLGGCAAMLLAVPCFFLALLSDNSFHNNRSRVTTLHNLWSNPLQTSFGLVLFVLILTFCTFLGGCVASIQTVLRNRKETRSSYTHLPYKNGYDED